MVGQLACCIWAQLVVGAETRFAVRPAQGVKALHLLTNLIQTDSTSRLLTTAGAIPTAAAAAVRD